VTKNEVVREEIGKHGDIPLKIKKIEDVRGVREHRSSLVLVGRGNDVHYKYKLGQFNVFLGTFPQKLKPEATSVNLTGYC